MDTSSLLLGAAFAVLGAGRLALAGRDSRVCLVTLPAIGAVVTGAGLMIIALLGPLPQHPTVGAVAVVAMMGVGLILLIARPILSRLGRWRWFRYHAGNIFQEEGGQS